MDEWESLNDYTRGRFDIAIYARELLYRHPEIHKIDLANAIGIDRGTLDGWLSGKVKLTPAKYQMFLDGLNAICKKNGIEVLDVTPKGLDVHTEQAREIVNKARESLQNIIMYLSSTDLVNLENVAWGLYQNDPRILRHFYDCTPPFAPDGGTPEDIKVSWSWTMRAAEAQLQAARDVEHVHDELVELTQKTPQIEGAEPEYPSWQAVDNEARGLTVEQYFYPHWWLEAWPEDRKDEYNYYLLAARVCELDEYNDRYKREHEGQGKYE